MKGLNLVYGKGYPILRFKSCHAIIINIAFTQLSLSIYRTYNFESCQVSHTVLFQLSVKKMLNYFGHRSVK